MSKHVNWRLTPTEQKKAYERDPDLKKHMVAPYTMDTVPPYAKYTGDKAAADEIFSRTKDGVYFTPLTEVNYRRRSKGVLDGDQRNPLVGEPLPRVENQALENIEASVKAFQKYLGAVFIKFSAPHRVGEAEVRTAIIPAENGFSIKLVLSEHQDQLVGVREEFLRQGRYNYLWTLTAWAIDGKKKVRLGSWKADTAYHAVQAFTGTKKGRGYPVLFHSGQPIDLCRMAKSINAIVPGIDGNPPSKSAKELTITPSRQGGELNRKLVK